MSNVHIARERERQQALMAALVSRADGSALQPWLAQTGVLTRFQRGIQSYQANAGASAERALAAAFPTVQALVGDESFAALARAFWQAEPPVRGDLACFGAALPAFIARSDQLADVPYLGDTAQLDWLLAQAEHAEDAAADLSTLNLLAEAEPSQLRLHLAPGTAVLASDHAVVSVWQAHQPDGDWAAARQALAAGQGEQALVWREGWRAQALAVSAAQARWTQALLRGDPLDAALDAAGDGFAFEPWLMHAVQRGWLARAQRVG